jgi:hypothetical protein
VGGIAGGCPATLGFADAAESRFVLEHHPNGASRCPGLCDGRPEVLTEFF